MKELCLKNLRRKDKEPPTIHFIWKAAELISRNIYVDKYEDPINLVI